MTLDEGTLYHLLRQLTMVLKNVPYKILNWQLRKEFLLQFLTRKWGLVDAFVSARK